VDGSRPEPHRTALRRQIKPVSVALTGYVRVGLKYNLWRSDGTLAASNGKLVLPVATVARRCCGRKGDPQGTDTRLRPWPRSAPFGPSRFLHAGWIHLGPRRPR
jgi:hypothetical protein